MDNACSTCARTYSSPDAAASEKPLFIGRELPCCSRSICASCLNKNKRYETYCPYCQITTEPSLLPQGLKDPPAYSTFTRPGHSASTPAPISTRDDDQLPAYSANPQHQPASALEKASQHEQAPDVLHFVAPTDSMHSLALAYGVPIDILRKTNNIFADHLLQARRTVLISGEYYTGGVSLSPRPLEGEEEEAKKQKVRRWQVGCKVAEYDVALLYLGQADWDLDAAIQAYRDDERWEKEHPLDQKPGKGKAANNAGMRRFVGDRR